MLAKKACSCAGSVGEPGSGSESTHRLEHGARARNFVSAKQVRLAQRGQHGEERFGATHFLTKEFKRVCQGVADRESERAQSECIEEDAHLMAHAHRAVLEVAVIKAKSRIDED